MGSPLKHVFVTFLDVLELVPFGFSQKFDGDRLHKLEEDQKELDKIEEKLFRFALSLEKTFGERLCFIGEDVIGEKLYRRFLFERGGFLEVMIGLPVAMNAHFSYRKRAIRFSDALKKTLEKFIKDKKRLIMVTNLVEVREDDPLTIATWNKIHGIRTGE